MSQYRLQLKRNKNAYLRKCSQHLKHTLGNIFILGTVGYMFYMVDYFCTLLKKCLNAEAM